MTPCAPLSTRPIGKDGMEGIRLPLPPREAPEHQRSSMAVPLGGSLVELEEWPCCKGPAIAATVAVTGKQAKIAHDPCRLSIARSVSNCQDLPMKDGTRRLASTTSLIIIKTHR